MVRVYFNTSKRGLCRILGPQGSEISMKDEALHFGVWSETQ